MLPGSYDLPGAKLLDLVAVMDRLRSPGGCPWDAKQTHRSLVKYLLEEAYEAEDEWADGVRAGIGAMLTFLASEPNLARLAMVEALVAGPVVVERYDASVQTFLPYLTAGREGRSKAVLDRLSDSTEEALVGGMVSLVARRIVAGQTEELESLLPDLVEFTLAPYVGNDEAARIART